MAARTGEQFLRGLAGRRDLWVGGDKVSSVVDHPALSGAAQGAGRGLRPSAPARRCLPDARPRDRRADQCQPHDPAVARRSSAPSSRPRTRRRILRRPDGPHARLHERHFRRLCRPRPTNGRSTATSAGRRIWLRYQKKLAREDLSLTHTIIHSTVDMAKGRNPIGLDPVQLHKVERDGEHGILVRGSRVLATLAPFSDELAVYPSGPMPRCRARARVELLHSDGYAGPEVHLPRQRRR